MTDNCMNCFHAVPAQDPSGRINFRIKMCIERSPSSFPVPGVGLVTAYPTVDEKTTPCHKWQTKEEVEEEKPS